MSIKIDDISPFPKVAELVTGYLNPEPPNQDKVLALVRHLFEESQKPWSIIFLGIEGVLKDGFLTIRAAKLEEKLGEMFQKSVIEKGAGVKELWGYTRLQHLCACSYFFHRPSVQRLEELIGEVSKVSRAAIVISCGWGALYSVEELRDQIFAPHKFSAYILDKLPKKSNVRQTRADQIQLWQKQNHKLNIRSFVILSSKDKGFSTAFPDHFLEIYPRVLLSFHQERALKILRGEKIEQPKKSARKDLSLHASTIQKRLEGKRQPNGK